MCVCVCDVWDVGLTPTNPTRSEEKYNAKFRKHLRLSGVPVENSKGEAGIGQGELNVRYSDALQMSDRHLVYKQCLKEVSDKLGASITFMAKPYTNSTGSGCHIHLRSALCDRLSSLFFC